MIPGRRSRWLRIALAAMFLGAILGVASQHAVAAGTLRPVPKASCGAEDRTESGLQGQTTLAERFSSGPSKAYNCNLELVGQFIGEGSSFGLQVFENCAYYPTWNNPDMRNRGVVVLDISDPRHPRPTAHLATAAALHANESLEIDKTRKLLVASKVGAGKEVPFDVYDLSRDCRHPALVTSTTIPGMWSHVGQFTPDGQTFFAAPAVNSGPPGPQPALFVIDMSNPARPQGIATWMAPKKEWLSHAVRLNEDATRAYVALWAWSYDRLPERNGLLIVDVSDIQARRPNPQFRLISTLFFEDTLVGHVATPAKIKGRPYLIWSDGGGSIPVQAQRSGHDCRAGKPSHGFARIIDIADEKNPRTVSTLMLEANDPANCSKVVHDPTLLGYGSEGCDVDNDKDAKLLACAYYEAGLRVFDIHDPLRPREIAYYKPPARRTDVPRGSPFSPTAAIPFSTSAAKDHTADVAVFVEFLADGQIAFNSFDNGFQVVRFSDQLQAAHPHLFRN